MPNICVFGPHPDDQELGMGGAIARLADQGHDVLLVDMTDGEPTPMGDHQTRKAEAAEAVKVLAPQSGSGKVERLLLGLTNREVEHTLAARHAAAGVIRAHQADILFVPYFEDAHPDHRAVTRIVEDARFDAKLTKVDMPAPTDGWTGKTMELGPPIYPRWLFYYYCTHLRWVADPSFCFDITGYEDRKRRSIEAYTTQFVLPEKNREIVEWLASANHYIGSRIGVRSAEPFFTKEPVGLTDLSSLVMEPRPK